MNYTQLRAFHAVAEAGGFTQAARALGITQPTLSAQVKALEEEHGVALFDRRGRGVAQTSLGEALLAITRRLFLLEEEAQELLSRARALAAGHLRVGADDPSQAVPLIAAFRRRYPGIRVSLAMGNAEAVLDALLHYRSDVAVMADVAADPRLEAIRLAEHPIVVFVPRGHPWAKRKQILIAELAGKPMVLREEGSETRRRFEAAAAAAGVAVTVAIEIETREAVREAVAAGFGIGVVSEAELGHDPRLVAVPVKGAGMTTAEYAVCLKERRNLRIVSAFFALVGRS